MATQKNNKPHHSPVLRIMQYAFITLGSIFPKAMGIWAYKLWFTPARFNTPHHEIEADTSASKSILSVNDIPVSVLSWGEGPAVLFVHGWMGRGTQAGYFLQGLTQAGYRVISFDAPAHGKTPGKQTSIFEITDVLIKLDQKYGPFEAAITHSFGGMILAYAMNNGISIKKIVNICPIADINILVDNFSESLCIPDRAMKVMLDKLAETYGADLAERISTLKNVEKLSASALVIHDENDEDIPWQSGKAIADAWQKSEFILTQGLGHRRILRDADTVRQTVNFITGKTRE